MKTKPVMLSFIAGCAATAALAWAVGDVRAANSPTDPVIHVCAAADGVLRLTQPMSPCPAGQRRLLLRKAESDAEAPEPEKEAPAKSATADAKQLADLEKRVDALEQQESNGELAQTVKAPFKVVDRAGKPIMEVTDEGYRNSLLLHNPQGKGNIVMSATDSGGYLFALSTDRKLGVGFGIAAGADFRIVDLQVDKPLVMLGRSDTGTNYRLLFRAPNERPVAAFGERADKPSGLLYIYDTNGKERVSLGVSEEMDSGYVAVMNSDSNTLAALAQENGSGKLEIFGPKKEVMVKAYVEPPGYGVVRAGPEGFKPGVGLLGLPGSYIAGKTN